MFQQIIGESASTPEEHKKIQSCNLPVTLALAGAVLTRISILILRAKLYELYFVKVLFML